jgi:hypothetical protein
MLPGHDFTNGWGELFASGLEVIQGKGNHSSIVSDENNLADLGQQINAVLDRRESACDSPTASLSSARSSARIFD